MIFVRQWHVQSNPFETRLPQKQKEKAFNYKYCTVKTISTFHWHIQRQRLHPTCTSFLLPSFSTLSIKSSNCSLGYNRWAQFSIFCISRRRSSAWLDKTHKHHKTLAKCTYDEVRPRLNAPQASASFGAVHLSVVKLLPRALCLWNGHHQTAFAELEVLFLRSAWRK